jgi:hypothetical protein
VSRYRKLAKSVGTAPSEPPKAGFPPLVARVLIERPTAISESYYDAWFTGLA